MKEEYRETFAYADTPEGHCFTYDGCSVVFYEDTEKGEARSFHSYMNGDLYRAKATPPYKMEFYACDIYGNYIPVSYVQELKTLKRMVKELHKELEKGTFVCTLPTNIEI